MILGWGMPRIVLQQLGVENAKFIEMYHPVEGTTELTTTKGDKTEAKIEGGENEAVKYGKNTYALVATVRQGTEDGKIRPRVLKDIDGVIEGEYEVWLQPENKTAPGIHIHRATVSVEDTWTAADGGQLVYTIDALSDGVHKQVETGLTDITGEYLKPTAVNFVAAEEDATPVTPTTE